MSLLVVMGSGETAPTMVKVHRQVLAESTRATAGGLAVMLDTPFGFQMNADDLVTKTRQYFAASVGAALEIVHWRRADAPVVEREKALALLGRAGWAFAGPGSPTYALRQWQGTPVPEALAEVAGRGGALVFGSAAACTLGTHAIPVYEIYKVGEEPHWVPGLNLLGRLTGIDAVVIPHFDNAEGGRHDTRYCYLGEERLARLEAQLAEEVGVLGVDEHTALLLDPSAGTARVTGAGMVTVRRRGVVRTFGAASVLSLDRLNAMLRGAAGMSANATTAVPETAAEATTSSPTAGQRPAPSLRSDADLARERFEAAMATGHIDGCVAAILDLEAAIVAWSADTLQSDATGHARRVLRSLIVRLGELAQTGARDPSEAVRPYVDLLLDLRGRARAAKDYAMSDLVRDRLVESGVEVRDTPDGTQWSVRGPLS